MTKKINKKKKNRKKPIGFKNQKMTSTLVKFPRAIARTVGIAFAGFKDNLTRIRELREIKRIEKQRTITVKFPDDNNIIQETQGKLSEDLEWIYLPVFKRVQKIDKKYKDLKLISVIYTSLRSHKTLDLTELNEQTIEFYSNAKKKLITLGKAELRNMQLTTDLSIQDNPVSEEFSIDADRVFATKSLEILEEPARRTIMVMFLFGIAVGMIITFFTAYLLLLWLG